MEITRIEDEHLEVVWLQREKNLFGREFLKERMGAQFSDEAVEELEKKGYLKDLELTEKGTEYTERLIRAHRLAERLLSDVLGLKNYEVGACEFEHIMNREILDGLCTLLGHPEQCPHGLPIPRGECCRNKEKQVNQAVHSLTSLQPGDTLKILYIQTRNDRELHILEGMRIGPGKTVKVHQTHPSLVIEVEGTHIALDETVGEKILGLAQESTGDQPPRRHHPGSEPGRRGMRLGQGHGRGFRRGRRQR